MVLTFYTQARWKLTMRLGATLIWVDACMYPIPTPDGMRQRLMFSTSHQMDTPK